MSWRLVVSLLGACLLVVCSAMALGIVTVSSHGIGLDLSPGARPAAVEPGSDGVSPGSTPRSLPVTVSNNQDAAFDVTAVQADLTGLPASCPASAWSVGTPATRPTVPAGGRAGFLLPVGLLAAAPSTCQGLVVHLPIQVEGVRRAGSGGPPSAVRVQASVTVAVATLGSPTGQVSRQGSSLVVLPQRSAAGPAPDGFDVSVVEAPGRSRLLCSRTSIGCTDPAAPAAGERSYLITARLGDAWLRPGLAIRTWTPPPAPILQPTGVRGQVRLHAAPGQQDYQVTLQADGTAEPLRTFEVAAGSSLERDVSVWMLGGGEHRIVAVARFHDWRSPSQPAHLSLWRRGVSGRGGPVPNADEGPNANEGPGADGGPTPVPTRPSQRPPDPSGSHQPNFTGPTPMPPGGGPTLDNPAPGPTGDPVPMPTLPRSRPPVAAAASTRNG